MLLRAVCGGQVQNKLGIGSWDNGVGLRSRHVSLCFVSGLCKAKAEGLP